MYCRGATQTTQACGVNTNELTATGKYQSVKVSKMPYYSVVSGKRTYPACYYHIKVTPYTYKNGAKINIHLSKASDVQFKVIGGKSL